MLRARLTATAVAVFLAAAGIAGAQTVPPPTTEERLAALGPEPDGFKTAADGTDDAPSVQRAIAAACAGGTGRTIRFRARRYAMNSPVTQPCLAHWQGQGWQEPSYATTGELAGTWLEFSDAAFGPAGAVTITGAGAGTRVADIAVTQPFAAPADGATSWSPPETGFVFSAENTNGAVEFRHIMCRGVTRCIRSHLAGRTTMQGIYGQSWRELLFIDKAYDSSKLDDIHYWPYRTLDPRVMAWTQAHAVALLTQRSDTPLVGRVFALGVLAGILIDASAAEGPDMPAGTTSGMTVDSLSCDAAQHCLYIAPAAVNAQVQVGQLRSYGQRIGFPAGVMLPGSDVIGIDGPGAVVQVDNAEDFGTGRATIQINATASAVNVQVGSLRQIRGQMGPNTMLAFMANGPGHRVNFAMPPMLTPGPPPGWVLANPGTNGTVSWPDAVKRN